MSDKKWEYAMLTEASDGKVQFTPPGYAEPQDTPLHTLLETLNDMGQRGFEIAAAFPGIRNDKTMFLKRKVRSAKQKHDAEPSGGKVENG